MSAGTGAGNNLIRSLRADAGPILGCHHDPFLLKKSCADRNYLVPSTREPELVAALRAIGRREKGTLVLPTTDDEVERLSRERTRIGLRVFLPDHDVVEICQDKFALTTALRARGVPAPETYAVGAIDDVPALFKQLGARRRLWCRARKGAGSVAATDVETIEQARSWIAYWNEMRDVAVADFTLSEYLPGRDFACQSLWKDGALVLIKTTERISYFGGGSAPSGVSSIGAVHKTVREPRLVEIAAAAVRALDGRASGAFSVDLKENVAGVPCVTEINVGRFLSGTTIFDVTGKHNMATTFVRIALGQAVAIDDPYDAVDDYYMTRDLDTLPDVFQADELFDGFVDLRSPGSLQRTRPPRRESTTWARDHLGVPSSASPSRSAARRTRKNGSSSRRRWRAS